MNRGQGQRDDRLRQPGRASDAGEPPGNDRPAGVRLLVTPKWLFGHLLALALVLLFVNFGFWQLDRLEERTARNELTEARMEAAPAALETLLEEGVAPEDIAYRRAFTRGTFATEHEILLRSRSRDGQPGWHLLTPLLLGDGRALLVDRGWVPRGLDRPPVAEAAPPDGEVRVEGLVRLEEDPPQGWAANLSPRDPPDGELERSYYVDLERLAPQYPFELVPVYLQLTRLEPEQPGRLPLPPLLPEFSRGPHLSYALQWFSFALIGIVGYAILLRRTVSERESRGDR